MGKKAITFSLDVEASGPIPGSWWMCSFGICRTDDVTRGFARELKPLVLPGVSKPDDPGAMQVVAAGLEGVTWDPSAAPGDNVALVRRHFEERGVPPDQALRELGDWLATECGGQDRPIIVGSPVTFDFMWIYWYWWHHFGAMPPFGFSGLDLRSYFMGMHGVGFLGTGKARYLKHYPNEFAHTHDPLEDARQQGRIWQDMVDHRTGLGRLKKAPPPKPPGSASDL